MDDLGEDGVQPRKEHSVCGIADPEPDNGWSCMESDFLIGKILVLRDEDSAAIPSKVTNAPIIGF